MKFKDYFNLINYFGYDKKTYDKYKKYLDYSNIFVLTNILIFIFVILIFVVFLNYIIDRNIHQAIISAVIAFIFLFFILLSRFFYSKKENYSSLLLNSYIDITSMVSYSLAIYLGVFAAPNDYAISIIIMFIIFQVVFDRSIIRNLLPILFIYTIFLFFSFTIKDLSKSIYDLINSSIAITIASIVSWNKVKIRLKSLIIEEKLTESNNKLYVLSTIDGLTKLQNRAKIFNYLNKIKEKVKKNGNHFFCIIIDIDDFKQYNDFYGHPNGDKLLIKLGELFLNLQKKFGFKFGRIGGEEFMCIGEVYNYNEVENFAKEIQKEILNLKIVHKKSLVSKYVTVSIGVYCSKIKSNSNIEKAYIIADKGLYYAKDNGKNCCYKYNISTKKFTKF